MTSKIVFLDLRQKTNQEKVIMEELAKHDDIISLSPYSSFFLDKHSISYSTLSDVENDADFHDNVISLYKKIEANPKFIALEHRRYILRDIAKYITYDRYLSVLKDICNEKETIYIHDGKKSFLNLQLTDLVSFNKVLFFAPDNIFYKINRIRFYLGRLKYSSLNSLLSIFTKDAGYTYDNKHYAKKYKSKNLNLTKLANFSNFQKSIGEITNGIVKDDQVANKMQIELQELSSSSSVDSKYVPFTFLHGREMYSRCETYKCNNIPVITMQHGSYVHQNYFLKFNEVQPSDINFVFNRFTKSLFENVGAKKVINVGSLINRKKLKNKKVIYDYVYITYCSTYSASISSIESEFNVRTVDGQDMYRHHKAVIECFGKYHTDKTVCIKIQANIMLGEQGYIPLIELAAQYSNVSINFTGNLFSIIEKSRYIISDYFSTEFSNPNVLKEKNIILFADILGFDSPEIEKDMRDLFIVADDIEQMHSIVTNMSEFVESNSLTKSKNLIEKYSLDCSDTSKRIYEAIDEYL